ncbi:ABC transporter permease [Dactylosporangium aurantiacum]|uniref:ABC transporter permease n=1 Tax=Dactylosporangium aurantiacum TaxID=35754 RepID=A0A9Q9IM76_9ACTN|nr:ABC transporter permease [Dactylosporangium aurantiacum]MDG6107681.1 ABC transporter permease [Dactylosporangium aurantiacum]UWZ58727.1 ABC transporter permease [Dactylosporangium aurantiacum]
MMRLAIATLRRHRGAYAGTFVAALLAVALLAGGGLLLYSVLTAKPPADRFAATSAVVAGEREISLETVTTKHKKEGKTKVKRKVKTERLTGAGTLPADLAGRLAAVPGVTGAVADYAFPVQATTTDGRALRGADDAPVVGHGWASATLTPYTLRDGQQPGPGTAVIDADLAARGHLTIGAGLLVTTRTGTRTVRVGGIAAPAGRDGLPAQGALFLADADVAAVSGLPGPTAVGIFGAADLAQVRAAAGAADVLTGADRVRGDLPGALPDYIGPISIFGFVIGITAFAAVFVLTGTVTLSVRQRLRELALLRAIGATPRQLRRILGLENVVLAAVAGLLAAPLGVLFAEVVAARFQSLGAVPAQFEVRANVPVLLLAAAAGILVTFGAARIAGRRAVRIAPTQALVETATAPTGGLTVRLLTALVTTAGAVAVLTFVPLDGPFGMGMSFISTALLLCAVAAVGPLLVRLLTTVVARPFGLAGLVARAEYRRISAVAVPLVLMFAINTVMLLNGALSTRLAGQEQVARQAPATAQVVGAGGLPLSTVRRLTELPGVTGAAAQLPTRVIVAQGGKPEDYQAQGILVTGTDAALDLGVIAGGLTTDGFGASSALVRQYGWRIGDIVPLWLADGQQQRLRLSMVYGRARGFGDLVIPADLVAAHDPRGLVRTVGLRYTQGTDERIRAEFPGLRLTPTLDAAPPGDASNQQGAWELMVVISLGFTAIGVVNTFAIAATARRREYADLRLIGATTPQLHRLAGAEAVVTVLVGLLLGAAVTGVVVGAFSVAQDGVLRVFVEPVTYAAMAGGVAALGLIAGFLPTRLMLRRRALASRV